MYNQNCGSSTTPNILYLHPLLSLYNFFSMKCWVIFLETLEICKKMTVLNRILPLKRNGENIFEKFMKISESTYKLLPVKINGIFINEYFQVKYIKIKKSLNCFISLRKLTHSNQLRPSHRVCYSIRSYDHLFAPSSFFMSRSVRDFVSILLISGCDWSILVLFRLFLVFTGSLGTYLFFV